MFGEMSREAESECQTGGEGEREMLGPRSLCPTLRLHLSHLGKVRVVGSLYGGGVGAGCGQLSQGCSR